MPQKDVIGIKFGVAGGGSISGESGRIIKSQLESIVSQIKLKVSIDQEHFRKQVTLLKKELDGKLGKLQIGVNAVAITNAGTTAPSKTGTSKKISDAQRGINAQLKEEIRIRKEIAKIGDGKRDSYRAQLEKELSTHESIRRALEEQIRIAKEKIQINTVGLPLTANLVAAEQDRLAAIEKELGLRQLSKEQLLEIESITARTAAKEQDSAEDTAHRLKTKFMGVQAAAASLLNRYKDLIKHNQDAAGWADRLGDSINQTFDDLPVQEKNERLREFVQLVREADTNFNQLSVATDTFATKLRRVFERRVFITLSVLLVGTVMRAMRQVYQNVVALDTAMANLRTVVRGSERAMNDFSRSAAQSARRLGVSIVEVIEATTAFARLGYNLRDAQILAEQAIIYSRITGENIGDIAENISAAISAFGLGTQDLERVLDQFLHIGNNFTISSEQIARAMCDSAVLLAANGNTLQEALGLLGAANAALGNESSASNAMHTIVARLSRDKSELRRLGEDISGVMTTARLDNRMLDFGVAIKDANGNLRSTFSILNDVSRVWGTLTQSQQDAVAMMIAGERQQAAFFAIMENWGEAEGIVASYRDGVGSLREAQEEYINSVAGQLERLNATWQEFSETLLNSAIIKMGIQFLTGIATVLNYILSIGDGFLVTIPLITIALVALWTMLKKVKAAATFKVFIKGLKGVLAVFPAILAKLKAMRLRIRANTKATMLNTKATILNAKAIKAKAAAQKAAAATNPLGWIMLAVAALIAIISLLRRFSTSLSDITDRARESKEAWQQAKSDLDDVNSQLDEVAERIKELEELKRLRPLDLVERNELERLEESNALLQDRRRILETLEQEAHRNAARDAATAANAIAGNDKLAGSSGFWRGFVTGITGGISDIFGYGAIAGVRDQQQLGGFGTDQDRAGRILSDWENATDQQRDFVNEFIANLKEQESQLMYFANATEQWQRDVNAAYLNIWAVFDRYNLATSAAGFRDVWESLLVRQNFAGSTRALTHLANAGEVTAGSLLSLYNTNSDVGAFIRYLQELGTFSWDCAYSLDALVASINNLWESQLFRVSRLDHLDILDETTARFDALARALEDIERVGVVSAQRLRDVLETFPELSGYFTATSQGFRVSDDFSDMSVFEILSRHAAHSLQEYVDRLGKAERQLRDVQDAQDGSLRQKEELERALQAVTSAQENLTTATEVWATHLRAQAIRDRTDALNEHRGALNDQLSAYRALIDIRRDLLRTYRREIEYQKELARRQKNVVDLQTQLRLARMDTSAAGRARVRELESQLQTAQDDLDAFTLERAIEVLTAHLDNEFREYQQLIESQVDRIVEEIANLAKYLNVVVEVPPPDNTNIERALLQGQLSNLGGQINSQQQSADDEHRQRAALEQALRDAEGMSTSGWSGNLFRGGWWGNDSTAANNRNAAIDEATNALNNFNSAAAEQARLDQLRQERDGVIRNLHSTGMTREDLRSIGISEDDLRRLGIYHQGGFVGGLKTNEEFARLLKGEFVATPQMMNRFMSDTLPNIAVGSGGNIFNAPIVEVHCQSVTRESLPDLRRIVNEASDKAVEKIKSALGSGLDRAGQKGAINKFTRKNQ